MALALAAAVYLYAHKDEGKLEESKARGSEIVSALARYRTERGDYPAVLEELTPTYLPAIEPPTWGLGRWRYERYGRGAGAAPASAAADSVFFMLSVAASETGYPLLYYDYTTQRWVLNN